jgi:hypothetical protein
MFNNSKWPVFLIYKKNICELLNWSGQCFGVWLKGKHACVDLTGVFPLVGLTSRDFTVGLTSRDFTVGQTVIKAASSKVKHEKACSTINMHLYL